MQKATLDPSKISGFCGRLKCCLRYEDKTYSELKKRLPKKNARVQTPKGQARVIDTQILTQLVMVEYENGDKEALGLDEIEVLKGRMTKPDSGKNNREDDDVNDDSDDTENQDQ